MEEDLPGLWRYRHAFGLPEGSRSVYLGEGDTPLVTRETELGEVAFKLEYLNPTGSHKDRGTAVLAALLKARGVQEVVEDSSGNAGASLAAYAAAAGFNARIFIPDYASGPKRDQIEAYGAQVTRILGARSDVAEAVRRAAEAGTVYASHAHLPQFQTGFATIAYELCEQLGKAPGSVVMPVGQGGLLLGIAHGFTNLHHAGLIDRVPSLVGVQAMACAPLWAVFTMGAAGLQWVTEGVTAAEGVRIRNPVRGDQVLRAVVDSGGSFASVEEDRIPPARAALAQMGLYVEPTSAIVWDALRQLHQTGALASAGGPVVAVLTGSGLKRP
ncbi:MAG TPA: pyridoxal-phosphate dependent enzyme [Anaerolineales bacterium]|nr:pyridoxal-phosphate dependent enzyme [Anaerolineales bacterium]